MKNRFYLKFSIISMLTVLFFSASNLTAQVTFDNNAVSATTNTGTSLTVSNLGVPAGNNALVVVMIRNGPVFNTVTPLTPSSVTFNSQNLTLLNTAVNVSSSHHIYYLTLGNLGAPVTSNVVINFTDVPVAQSAIAFSLKGVNQTTPMINPAGLSFGGTATSSSAAVTGAVGNMALDSIGAVGTSGGTAPTFATNSGGQTEIATVSGPSSTGFGLRLSVSRKLLTGTPSTLDWTISFPVSSTGAGVHQSAVVQTAASPTAAAISLGGRVTLSDGRGVMNAVVYLTDQNGNIRQSRTNAFGYYRFNDLSAGQTFVAAVQSKQYQFAPQVVSLTEDFTELNFVSLP